DLYKETESQPGGWEGYRSFYIDKKVEESDNVTSFYLKPKDDKAIASYKAGQYLTLAAAVPGEKYTHIRHYSLSEAPGKDYYRISVKREDAHDGAPTGVVSNYLHNQVETGGMLKFSAPAGDFVLDDSEQPVVLISGGIGITPLLSMLNTIVEKQPTRQVTFIHAAINGKTHAFKEHVAQLDSSNENVISFTCYSSPSEEDRLGDDFDKEGYVDLELLQSIVPSKEAVFYFCGSIPFMEAILKALHRWDIPNERIHYEVFSPVAILG
ncbi:nitric oxide dioxygenase, partial [Priestia megaterium]|uniref:FAD-binding oxidoreductase n=1 Tax=Priestia megaterium TaxID=1404 RepID=UPI001C8EEC3C